MSWRRWWKGRDSAESPPDEPLSLAQLQPGESAEIIAIDGDDPQRQLKLSSLGVIPGVVVRVQQRHPATVIWVDETQLSLDDSVARAIRLRRPPTPAPHST